MNKESFKLITVVKPSLAKNEGYWHSKNDFNYTSVIRSLNFLTNSIHPEAQFKVHQCAQFRTDSKILHDKSVKLVIKYIKGTVMQGLIVKPNIYKGVD